LLICANHANSLVDPVLIGIGVRRPVRFLAKAPLFDVPVFGALMRAFGMLPAYRGSDDRTQVRKNLESLDAAAQVLAEGHAMGIFPEGKSHDETRLEPVKSGASRIAIQAVEAGVKGVVVLPVGVNYENKERFRSSVWIQIGEPLDIERWLESHGGDTRVAMRALTPEIERRLQVAVVHLHEAKWQPFLQDLEVLYPARSNSDPVASIRQRKLIADAMNFFATTDRPRAEAIAGRIAAYRSAVHEAGLEVDSPVLIGLGWRRVLMFVSQLFWGLALFLPAIAGTLFHIIPFAVVRFVAARVRPPGRTTVAMYLMIVGIPIYLGWYGFCAYWMYQYFATWIATLSLALMPVCGLVALTYWRRATRVTSLWWHQLRFVFGRERLRKLRAERLELQELLAQLAAEFQSQVSVGR
jgi:1-acyl-sn-glycerol-3-phosphate acyltransferase